MKKLLLLLSCSGLMLFCVNLNAQSKADALMRQLIDHNDAKITLNRATNKPSFIRFPKGKSPALNGNSIQEKAQSFLTIYGKIYGIKLPEKELFLAETKEDLALGQHLIFHQKYNDILVEGGDFRLHFDEFGRLTAANGCFIPDLELETSPVLSETQAAQIALNLVLSQQPNIFPTPNITKSELMIFRKGLLERVPGKNYLVYKIEIGNQANIREFVYVNAQKGQVIEQFTGIHGAKNRILFEYDPGTMMSTLVWTEGDAFPGSLTTDQQNEVAAAGHTYNLFFYTFNRDSYDGSGAQMVTINNAPIGCPNASWNGTNTNYCSGTAADDVVAHEWGHAITEYTAGLIYAWQSGALNESYSDIWGETVDLLNGYGNDVGQATLRTDCANTSLRWQMGEDATAFGGSIRDMWDPTCDGDPGKVSDTQYICGTGDSGGVHTNSGVNNHAYALLVDGGTYNGQTITGIGLTKSAHIFWQALNVYLTRISDFNDQADALEAACSDLLGIDLNTLTTAEVTSSSGEMITTADCQEVTKVITAVEFRTPPTQCNFSPMLDPNTPDQCSAGTTVENIFFDDFEAGLAMWTVSSIPSNPATWEPRFWVADASLPDGRAGSGAFATNPVNGDCSTDLENGILRLQSPVINVPAAATAPVKMAFDQNVSTEFSWDGCNLKYSRNGGAWTLMPAAAFTFNSYNQNLNTTGQGNDNPMQGEPSFTGADSGSVNGSWGQSQLDLSTIGVAPGDNFQLRFELGSDGCNGWFGWYLDDVKIYTCAAILPIELVHFRVSPASNFLHLEWLTASESNNYGFEIQRSTSPIDGFEKIGFLAGKGDSQQNVTYLFDDVTVQMGITYYYRLRQIDYDNSESFSEIKVGQINTGKTDGFTVSPNPTTDVVQIKTNNSQIEKVAINVFDIKGQLVFTRTNLAFDNGKTELSLQELPSGIYFLKIVNAEAVWTERLLKY